ncbi:MAG TPA: polysaccharide deacetylase family protein [Phycisphaerales bacterium]|nr:polysaccharide deacetylase family protein [Phycisphaerales bacterium]
MAPAPSITHALSFDIEDWFHIVEVAAVEDPARWPELHSRSIVERYTDQILEICARTRTRATFFVLGWVAERHPELVRRIADAGHELGTHSHWHRKVYELSPDEFRRDVARSLAVIVAAAPGARVRGFRAPSFSITPGCEWAFDVLLDLGLAYDASLFPARRGHGGYACPRGPHTITAPSGRTLRELPMSVADFGPRRLCYSGGGYLRLLPYGLIERGLAREAAAGRPTVVYLHPRDFAPDCPRAAMPPHRRFKCYVGLASTAGKLVRLLESHRFGTCAGLLGLEESPVGAPAPGAPPHRLDRPGPGPAKKTA